MLESHGLRVFVEVARLGSFTAAGQSLDYTQSAVSRQISVLEDEVGVALFDRLARGVRLTEPGRYLLAHAEAVLDRLDVARRELADLRDLAAGRVRVGAFSTAHSSLVPKTISAFRARHPKIAVSLRDAMTPRLLSLLTAEELDVAVVSTTADYSLDGVELVKLFDDTMFVGVPTAHRLAGRDRVRLAELADDVWIAGSSRPEDTLISSCLRNGFRPRIGFVVREWIAKQGFVAAGLGVTLIPSLAADAVRPDIALVSLHADDVPVREVFAATARGLSLSAATKAFLDVLIRSCGGSPR